MNHTLLQGKKGIIFGALDENSIAWKTALKVHEAGGKFVLSNAPIALRLGKIKELAEATNSEIIGADATSIDDLKNLVTQSQQVLGGNFDFVLHSIGMSPNVRKEKHYTDLNYDFYQKTLDISALSFHKVLQTCYQADALNPWASVVALTYIAAQRTYPQYSDMAEAKAMLESIARSFGYHYGKKNNVRINTISQSPTATTAGSGVSGFDTFFDYANKMSPLGNASAEACADYCVALFSDLTRYVTMQNLFHDGGYSSMGMSESLIEK
jgi:enoyl-[acyl-carrier protein] reductase I